MLVLQMYFYRQIKDDTLNGSLSENRRSSSSVLDSTPLNLTTPPLHQSTPGHNSGTATRTHISISSPSYSLVTHFSTSHVMSGQQLGLVKQKCPGYKMMSHLCLLRYMCIIRYLHRFDGVYSRRFKESNQEF